MNTLFVYHQNAAARRIAVMIGSMIGMSQYKECREAISMEQYKRVLLVLMEEQDLLPLADTVQHAALDRTVGIIVVSDCEMYAQTLRHQAEKLLGRPVSLFVFFSSNDLVEELYVLLKP